MMTISQIKTILDQEVKKYSNQFGNPQLRRILGQPFFTCELNKIPTLIYPRPIVNGEIYENPHFDEIKEQVRKTHKIIRLDIEIENNVAVLVTDIIVSY
jgi:hypothetical protein